MANTNQHIRKLTKIGGGRSYSVVIPMEMVKGLGWKERQKLVVRRKGKEIIIKDWPSSA
jgi:bifunctional DNA-binding transcriptional regulator/antitoxin component of YhaV-PrlF toxin-antitoxin module